MIYAQTSHGIISAYKKSCQIREELTKSLKNEEVEILKFLGIKIGDTVEGQECGSAGSWGAKAKFVVKSVKIIQPTITGLGPYISVTATKIGGVRSVFLRTVNGIQVVHGF